ncbi:MAG: exodeoxyribonuclease VII large subunit [Nitrospiraceae bacterium]
MSRQPSLFPSDPSPQAPAPPTVWTVSLLNQRIRHTLEGRFGEVWVEGEVSTLRIPSSGHVYFTLKDATSQIRAVLFRSAAQKVRFALREGLQIVVRGSLTAYEPRGEYQIVAQAVEPKGVGALQLAFEQLKQRLAAEGLFDPARKRPLPVLPQAIGVVTSLTGAAIRDILSVLGRRCPYSRIVIAPTPVQGDGAAEQIAAAIALLGESGLVDVLIVGRGGGSLEDLWSFNEEVVVRAIAACPVPVVSAVGHEIDVTLADFAADHRAPTPSAAAEAVVPVMDEVIARAEDFSMRLGRAVRLTLDAHRQTIALCRSRLQQQRFPIQRQAQRLDDLWSRLTTSAQDRVMRLRHRVELRHADLSFHSPRHAVRAAVTRVGQQESRLRERLHAGLAGRRERLAGVAASLEALSPLATLGRGYSIVRREPDGQVVRDARTVQAGDRIRALLAQGALLCTVDRTVEDRDSA